MPLLTRKHHQRLRFYWRGGARGGGSRTDNIDLDLAALEMITRRESGGIVFFTITNSGEKELAAEKDREVARRKPHNDMASRLGAWLRAQGRVTWENIELRAVFEDAHRAHVRPDVYSLVQTYEEKRLCPCIHEVKVSRADFLSDVANPKKRASYSQIAEMVYYAAPAGMIKLGEVPDECGLVVEITEGEFEVIKKPKKKAITLTPHHFMNLILKPGEFVATV